MAKMPVRWEPVLGIVRAPNEEQLHEDWQKIEAHWRSLEQTGAIRSFSTPAALALSPRLMEQNRQRLGAVDFAAARRALEEAIAGEGFSRDTFVAGLQAPRATRSRRPRHNPDPGLAQGAARFFELVVSGRPLFCRRPASHGRFRDHEQAGRNPRAKGNADARTTGRRSADDAFRLELHSHRS